MVAGPIPRSKARDYAIEHGIDDPDELDEFWAIIRKADNEATRLRSPKDNKAKPDDDDPPAKRQRAKPIRKNG